MSTKEKLVWPIMNSLLKEYEFKIPTERVINMACKYNSLDSIETVYNHFKSGYVSANIAIEFLSGVKPSKIEISAY